LGISFDKQINPPVTLSQMKKRFRFFRLMLYFFTGLLLLWIIAVQSGCMSMRIADADWSEKLHAKGQPHPVTFFNIPGPGGYPVHAAMIDQSKDSMLPMVVFVHGSPGSADAYLDYLADTVLSNKARLLAVDRTGFGFTRFGKPATALQDQTADIHAVVQQVSPGKKIWLVGHSMGGPVIARYAMDYPGEVAGMVIVAGSIDPDLEPKNWWEAVVDNPPVSWIIPKSLWASNHEIRPLQAELRKMLPLWAGIQCPVRIIHAIDDALVPVENVDFARKMLTGCPDLESTILAEGNHFILWSREELVKKTLTELMQKWR
jgi:pimeloyl-ACP methyl ester carboxylesterase